MESTSSTGGKTPSSASSSYPPSPVQFFEVDLTDYPFAYCGPGCRSGVSVHSSQKFENIVRDRIKQTGHVYVLEMEKPHTAIKIGYVEGNQGNALDRIHNRMISLQGGNPYALLLKGYMYANNPFFVEQWLHALFNKRRTSGGTEWFDLTPQELDWLMTFVDFWKDKTIAPRHCQLLSGSFCLERNKPCDWVPPSPGPLNLRLISPSDPDSDSDLIVLSPPPSPSQRKGMPTRPRKILGRKQIQ